MGVSELVRERLSGASRLLRLAGGLLAVSVVWFTVNLFAPVGPPVLLWLPTPFGAAVLTAVYWRTSRSPNLPPPTQRFWRHLTGAAVLVGMASVSQAADVLSSPGTGGMHTGPAMMTFDGLAMLLIIYALYRLPLGKQTFGELLRLLLDAGTVMLATAVFMWHFQTRPLLGGGDNGAVIASLALTVLCLVAVFAVAKVMLSGYTFLDAKGLRLLAVAMFIGAIAPTLQPLLATIDPRLFPMQVGIPAVFFFAAWSGEQQRIASSAPRRRGGEEERRRSFSFLPYGAVAAVDSLLIYVSFDRSDERVVAATAVLLTALVVLRQITAFRDNGRLLHRLNHGANHDALTQLPNRVYFHSRLQQAVSGPGDRPVAVALIDLDDFKEVNDTLGHEIGDLLLIAVAQRLNGSVRAEDTVARLGGDEFVVVLDGADPAAADLAAERMIEALRMPVLADGHELPIRASIGIADGRTGDEPSVLLRHADIAMYAAKNLSGTAHLHYRPEMATAGGNDHAHLGAELRDAVDAGRLTLLYQPIVALDDSRVMGAEALVRWAHPTRGMLAPDAFIPLAERTGLIVPLGRWVLRTAIRQLARWIAEHGDRAPDVLNVNVSARDLREPGFAGGVKALLGEYGVPADRLVLEITETMALEPGQSVTNLHQLRGYGVRVSLDDFGTGHSTLTLLHDCPIDEIKLDRSFTQAAVDGRVPVAAAVIHLAQALGLHSVAEGVETAEQAEQLLSLGYSAAQGFWFARPMTAERFGDVLADGRSLGPRPAAWQMSA